jgi:hypothetical protein
MKQLKLPFDEKARAKLRDPAIGNILNRLTRIESRLVQLMKHQGMTDDGRHVLPDSDSTHSIKE